MTTAPWSDALRAEPPVLVTGAAGFIGFHLAARLLDAGVRVTGVDNLSPYYDVRLKRARLSELARRPGFAFIEADIAEAGALADAVADAPPRRIVHLAAQAGVRHSLENPRAYVDANVVGFLNVLELCRALGVAHLVYASSSSVYGGNTRLPFAVEGSADHPVSLYAATKRANELMAHAYCATFGFPATGLRFFTVYGPWGRPDMAYWLFAEAMAEGRPIDVNNGGDMARDFTYVADVVEALCRLIVVPAAPDPDFDSAAPDPSRSWAPHRVHNVGNTRPQKLTELIAIIEELMGVAAEKRLRPMPVGDVRSTWADVSSLEDAVGYRPATPLREGLRAFTDWYLDWRRRRDDLPPPRR